MPEPVEETHCEAEVMSPDFSTTFVNSFSLFLITKPILPPLDPNEHTEENNTKIIHDATYVKGTCAFSVYVIV